MSQLLPCPSCNRHVRVEDPRCPFCEAELPTTRMTAAAVDLRSRGRVGRIAVLAAGAALVSAAASCDSATVKSDAGTGGQTMSGTGGGGGGGQTGSGGSSPLDANINIDANGGTDGGQPDVPVAIYAAAVALPRNKG